MNNNERAEVIRRTRESVLEEPERRAHFLAFQAASRPIIRELGELGYRIGSLGDLRHQGKPWRSALPVLLRWLPNVENLGVKEEIVRSLSVPWIGSKATETLIVEFRKYAPVLREPSNPWVGNQLREIPEEEKKAAPAYSLAWAIGNALSIVDVKGLESQIIELCENPAYGAARQMLVLGLSRFRSAHAEETALQLLSDDSVKLHAVIALGKMKSQRALPELQKLLADKKPGIRREARKAIASIAGQRA